MAYIPDSHLPNLDKHKYQTTGYSHFDNVLSKIIWEPLVSLFPNSLAPNLITFIGLIFMIASYLLMVPFDSTYTIQPPGYILCIAAFCQFMYQTLDACDGKQARKIGLASPLGMLMDHGCDSLSCTIIALSLIQGLTLGLTTEVLVIYTSLHTGFFMAHWEEYHTHYHRTHMFNWGVTEGQWTNIILMLITALYGSQLWNVLIYGFPLKVILIYGNAAWGLTLIILMIQNTFNTSKGIQPYLRLIPMIMLDVSLYFWFYNPLTLKYGPLIFLVHGLAFSELNSKLIICSSSIMKFGWFHLNIFIELLFLLEDAYLKVLPSEVTLFILCLYLIVSYCSFVLNVIGQLSNYLKIPVFSVNKKSQ